MPYVLVVDDEAPIRRLLTRWLAGWGYQAKEASNASDAIEQMTAEPAAIMLCDVMMPVHDGIWLTEQVRTRWPETAVIMASGAQDMETVMRMRKQGAVDYVTKPFGREMLRQALQRASERLSKESSRRRLPAAATLIFGIRSSDFFTPLALGAGLRWRLPGAWALSRAANRLPAAAVGATFVVRLRAERAPCSRALSTRAAPSRILVSCSVNDTLFIHDSAVPSSVPAMRPNCSASAAACKLNSLSVVSGFWSCVAIRVSLPPH